MAKSYYRNCVTCGRRIQMRRMPAGQWLPFEGYDTAHICGSATPPYPPQTGNITSPVKGRNHSTSGYDDLEFVNFIMPGEPAGQTARPLEATGSRMNTAPERVQARRSAPPPAIGYPGQVTHDYARADRSRNYLPLLVVAATLALVASNIFYYRRATNNPWTPTNKVSRPNVPAAETSLERHLPSATDYYQHGIDLTRAGKYDEAAEAYRLAVTRDPKMAQAHHELGYAYMRLRQWDKAAGSLKEAIGLKPDYADSHRLLGDSLMMLAQWEDAIEAYNDAIRLEPEAVAAYLSRAASYRRVNEVPKAIDSYLRVIELKPQNATAHYQLGLLYVELGESEAAAAEYEALLPLNPKLAEKLQQRLLESSQP